MRTTCSSVCHGVRHRGEGNNYLLLCFLVASDSDLLSLMQTQIDATGNINDVFRLEVRFVRTKS